MKRILGMASAIALGACAEGVGTPPKLNFAGCAAHPDSANGEPSFGCARFEATVTNTDGSPVISAFVVLADAADTSRYRVASTITDAQGKTFVEVRLRQEPRTDTGTVRFYATTLPAPHLGVFRCAVRAVHLRFARLLTATDTTHERWVLPADTVSSRAACQVQG